jgi:hypothetical protein
MFDPFGGGQHATGFAEYNSQPNSSFSLVDLVMDILIIIVTIFIVRNTVNTPYIRGEIEYETTF